MISQAIYNGYTPHSKQLEVHSDSTRFKVVAAGRRSGKTTLAINALIKHATDHPGLNGQKLVSWFLAETHEQARMVGWDNFFRYCPPEFIKSSNRNDRTIYLKNNHTIQFKGTEEYNHLRGVSLSYVILDEYGHMKPEVWTEIIRPALVDQLGSALFIGTPGADGSPHFQDLYNHGLKGLPDWKSWLFFTSDNPSILKSEIEQARSTLPPDIFKREFEADFGSTAGLIYNNFSHTRNVIPTYQPTTYDFIVGSIDPGSHNPTACLLTAWDSKGVGRIFREYYEEGKFGTEAAKEIKSWMQPYRPSYFVIDRASKKRDMTSGISVLSQYREILPDFKIIEAPNDPGSVWAGIDEVKKLIQPQPHNGLPRLLVSSQCKWFLWEIDHYMRQKRKYFQQKNEPESPRKLNDHLMDCIKNMVHTKPWMRPSLSVYTPLNKLYSF